MVGLSKQKQKYIQSLHNKKYRNQYGVFLVEGQKSILEVLDSDFEIEEVFLTEKAVDLIDASVDHVLCSEQEIAKVSSFRSNNFGVLVAKMKENALPQIEKGEWILVLDQINDPGNLGTIIRTADWYGIRKVVCSEQTVDFYNPKVISSTMGSFARITPYYTDLTDFLKSAKLPVFGAFLEGQNVHSIDFSNQSGILVIGSESHGISNELAPLITDKLTIPAFGKAESLNAGIATAILLDNIKRGVSGT
ncbi:TrmH family RNA methyltransferase [Jiulongibacter sp. NS-SX5]|uniref:TrmH family RNA methyltransferase n=1 Tax=Jiulongibacter sp. NS-SX5 TaxID=3463854 RepID=UPI004058FA6C